MTTTITFINESDDIGVIAAVLDSMSEFGVAVTTTSGAYHSGQIAGATWDWGLTLRDQYNFEVTIPIDTIDTVEVT